jgi:hypothetical protein
VFTRRRRLTMLVPAVVTGSLILLCAHGTPPGEPRPAANALQGTDS